jgi:hypothetical protein
VHVYRDADCYKATKVSGPTHNYLGLRFQAESTLRPAIEPQHLKSDDGNPGRIDVQKLLESVLAGVADANQVHGAPLAVAAIQYVPTDSARYDIYRELAAAISLRALSEQDPPK